MQVTLLGVNSMMAAADWLLGNVFDRFPTLQVILSEGGTGWIPYLVERADKVWHDHRIDFDPVLGRMHHKPKLPPSVNFREHMYVCLVDERFALTALDQMPVDNILFEGDYPHGDGLFPNNRSYLEKVLADVPDDDRHQDRGQHARRPAPGHVGDGVPYDLLEGRPRRRTVDVRVRCRRRPRSSPTGAPTW